jgi:hypothetical protein
MQSMRTSCIACLDLGQYPFAPAPRMAKQLSRFASVVLKGVATAVVLVIALPVLVSLVLSMVSSRTRRCYVTCHLKGVEKQEMC